MFPSLYSLGSAAALVQEMPSRIRVIAAELGIQPAARIDGVDHYTEESLQQIAEVIRQQRVAPVNVAALRARGLQ